MPEIRRNVLTGKWVVVAVERGKRPHQLVFRPYENENGDICPFCCGNENLTPPEVLVYKNNEEKSDCKWSVRVVPNKYPAFTAETHEKHDSDIFRSVPALGMHEVVIHSPDHKATLADLEEKQIELVLRALQERTVEACKNKDVKHVSLITNHRTEAGASLSHPHSQLFAGPVIPEIIETEINNFRDYRRENGKCLLCAVTEEELAKKERVIFDGEAFTVISPYAARLPFEQWIIPKNHSSRFENISDFERSCLASALKITLKRLSQKLNDPPFNLIIHTAPCDFNDDENYHWHIELVPRLTFIAGFELASGMTINIVSPENATKFLTDEC